MNQVGGGWPRSLAVWDWDIDAMQVQTSIREPATSTTSSPACLLGAASAQPSRSTGKERDAESGNDYFGARYCASRASAGAKGWRFESRFSMRAIPGGRNARARVRWPCRSAEASRGSALFGGVTSYGDEFIF
jgi:hypothetical protein